MLQTMRRLTKPITIFTAAVLIIGTLYGMFASFQAMP